MRRIEAPGHVRFLTFSCYRRLPLFSNDRIKDRFRQHLADCREKCAFRLLAWVLMPEHAHLLIQPEVDVCPVSVILRHLKGGLANEILARWRKLQAPILARLVDGKGKCHFWLSGGGYDRNIVTSGEYFEKLKYIHENPVTRRIATRPEDWPWSSARWFAGFRDAIDVPIDPFTP